MAKPTIVGPGFFPAPFELRADNPVHYHCVIVKHVQKPAVEIVWSRSCYHGKWVEADMCRYQVAPVGLGLSVETCMILECDPRAENRSLRLVRS